MNLKSRLVLAIAFGLAACSSDRERAEAVATPEPTPEYAPIHASSAPDDSFTGRERRAAASDPCVVADQNRDGQVTAEEAKVDPNLERAFGRFDKDQNGSLDREEWAALEQDRDSRHGAPQTAGSGEVEASRFENAPCPDRNAGTPPAQSAD